MSSVKEKSLFLENLKAGVEKIWLTSKEVAVYLGISPKSIRDMVYKGFLTPYKPFGRKLYFKKVEIDRLLESSKCW